MEQYLSRYSGYARQNRLEFIARLNNDKSIQANEMLKTINEKKAIDQAQFASRLAKLEAELQLAKSTLGKETMRIKHLDIARLHNEAGNFNEAIKNFMRAKEYSSIPMHQCEAWLDILTASMDMGNYKNLQSYLDKAETVINSHNDKLLQAKLRMCSGIVALHNKSYKQAADLFTDLDPIAKANLGSLLCSEDIALFGALCAVGGCSRREVRAAFDNPRFKYYLESAPTVRKFIQDFIGGSYSECLQFLQDVYADCCLDLHLSAVIDDLVALIKSRAVLQYFFPYSAVDLGQMSTDLGLGPDELEGIILKEIWGKQLPAKIDSVSGTLLRQQPDPSVAVANLIAAAERNRRDLQRSLLRLSLAQHGLTVRSDHSSARRLALAGCGGGGGGSGGVGGAEMVVVDAPPEREATGLDSDVEMQEED